jgi:5,10-methylenetetrahydrofolate reductase
MEKIMKFIKLFSGFLFLFTLNLSAAPEGAFTTLMVQAKDVDKYIEYMKKKYCAL